MKYFNFLYLLILLAGGALFLLQKNHKSSIISFYGYAENKETEINFNYPVQVMKIHVSPGQLIQKDAPLIDVSRIQTKQIIQDQTYKIDKISAEKKIWKTKVEGQIKLLEEEKEAELALISKKKEKILMDRSFNETLYEQLESINAPEQSNTQSEKQLAMLQEEYDNTVKIYDQRITNKREELQIGSQPYNAEIRRLSFEKDREKEQALVELSLTAPDDCLIGNVYCKESEHFNSYKTLLSVYEPNPSIIKGFIQEDFIMRISLNDSILVKSTKDKNLMYQGKVTGLGSRIVEIPSRLRKRPDIKTYGREIIVSIPKENQFLQKEKTVMELLQSGGTDSNSIFSNVSLAK